MKAQIKLQFRNASGKKVVCNRTLQLAQKGKKLEQRTLESALIVEDPDTGQVGGLLAGLPRSHNKQIEGEHKRTVCGFRQGNVSATRSLARNP